MSNPISRGSGVTNDRTWIESGSSRLKIIPFGFRKRLKFIKDEYGNPPIYVTENGVSEQGAVNLDDIHGTHFYENYINQELKGRANKTRWALHVCFFKRKVQQDLCYHHEYVNIYLNVVITLHISARVLDGVALRGYMVW